MATVEVIVTRHSNVTFNGAGTSYTVQTPAGVIYLVYVDANVDVMFRKSTDGGQTWSTPTTIFTGTTTQLSIWYDRWSNISAGLIHIAYTESVTDDVFYITINTESSDSLSTQTTIFAGATTAAGCSLSITRARGGNVYCAFNIDDGTESGFKKLANADVPEGAWSAALDTAYLATPSGDQIILVPGWAADSQDIMAFYWDTSASEIFRFLYDDSGDAWDAGTSISASMTLVASTSQFPFFAATVDITNSQNLLVVWTAADTLNADLLGWKVTESAITALTDIVTNSTDDQGLCGIAIDTATQDWYVYYGGASDGSETFATGINIYYKTSTDDGATWGSETAVTIGGYSIPGLFCTPRFASYRQVLWGSNQTPARLVMFYDIPATASGGGARVYGG
jgi:hypothetical protein